MSGSDLAARLVAARDPTAAALPHDPPGMPRDLPGAYAVQAAVVRLAAGGRLGHPWGWKIALANPAAQRWHKVGQPVSGRMFRGGLLQSPARLPAGRYRPCLIEPEIAFTLARDLPPRTRAYVLDEVRAAVGTLHPAMEIAASAFGEERWYDAPLPAMVADNVSHAGLVLGEGRRDFQTAELATLRVEVWVDGKRHGVGSGANALGNPLAALAWLANDLSRRGQGLAQGEVVTTGLLTPFVKLLPGQRAEAFYGRFGACRVTLDA